MYIWGPPLWVPRGLYIYIYMYLSVFCVLFFLSYSFALILSLVSSHHFSSECQNMVCRRNSTLSKVEHIFLYICLSSCIYIQQPLLPLLHLRPHFLTDRPVIRPHNAKRRYTAGQGIDSLNVENQFTFWVSFRAVYTSFKCVFPSLTILLAVRCSLVDLSQDAGTRTGHRKSWLPSVVAPPS